MASYSRRYCSTTTRASSGARKVLIVGNVYIRNGATSSSRALAVLPSCFSTVRCLLRTGRLRRRLEPTSKPVNELADQVTADRGSSPYARGNKREEGANLLAIREQECCGEHDGRKVTRTIHCLTNIQRWLTEKSSAQAELTGPCTGLFIVLEWGADGPFSPNPRP